ncbi:MAG: hypothetical protein IT160_04410 [Bryobacterales bacterium]|nr:hypothetical protein [Bryobacterales bacterium]
MDAAGQLGWGAWLHSAWMLLCVIFFVLAVGLIGFWIWFRTRQITVAEPDKRTPPL